MSTLNGPPPSNVIPEGLPPDPLAILRVAKAYAEAETARLNGPNPADADPVIPDLSPFNDAIQDGQTILFEIEPGYRDRFDIPMFLYLKVAIALRGFIRTNSRQAPKILGRSRFYVRIDFPKTRGRSRLNMQVNRIVANARPGERVREHPQDHHNHMPEVLTKTPSNDTRTRADAVAGAVRMWEAAADHPVRDEFTRDDYKGLMWQLLALADARWAERVVRDTVAIAPWLHSDLIDG